MRLARIAALVVSVPTVSDGQSPIVRGDSVRITVAGQPPTVGRVATVAGDTIRLDDGTQYRLADVRQVEVGRSGVDRQRQVVLAIVGGALGIVAAQLIPTNPDAFLNPTPALTAGGALAGMWLARRRVETQWHVAGVARDADPPRAVAADPPIQAAAFGRYREGTRLRIWLDTMRLVGAFTRVDEQSLYLRPFPPIALGSIDVVERRVDPTARMAVAGGLLFGLVGAFVAGIDCSIGGSCNNFGPVVGLSTASGAAVGAFIGSTSRSWRPEYARRR